jgi:hypothetical protein
VVNILKVFHPRCVDFKHNVVIRTVNKHNSVWYDITNVLNNIFSLATNVIILTVVNIITFVPRLSILFNTFVIPHPILLCY